MSVSAGECVKEEAARAYAKGFTDALAKAIGIVEAEDARAMDCWLKDVPLKEHESLHRVFTKLQRLKRRGGK